jgi:phosphoglycerate dehydrogenase-like enzyme
MMSARRINIAILDDYQNVALAMADWSQVMQAATVTVFNDHVADEAALVERLLPFDVVCVMRERTPLPRRVLGKLPRLKLIASTGPGNASIDAGAAATLGIAIAGTRYFSSPTIELTWALILAVARNIVGEAKAVRSGSWQQHVGLGLAGKTLGVVGLGNTGGPVARIGSAFGMDVIAWSQNLTADRAAEAGVRLVTKPELFRTADIVSVHVVLSERSRRLIGARDLQLMKSTAFLVNTSRGPIVDETALIDALRSETIAGAAVDVFDEEPLPQTHQFRSLPNLLASPHIGYVADDLYRAFYEDIVATVEAWLEKRVSGPP